jgi:glyoxylase-like metal-dependent hydrolase (beta-lactamase superfamily II)
MTRIHKIKLSVSNCYLVQGDKNILVDTGSPNEEHKIIKAINDLGFQLSNIALILHTHGHSDHCGSTKELIQRHKIPTAIHSADSHMTKNGRNDFLKPIRPIAKFIKPFVDKPFLPFESDMHIDSYNDLKSFGINGFIHSTPGHTTGSISIEFDNHEAIIGDIMMGGFFGGELLPHLPDYHYFAEELIEIRSSINKVLTFNSSTYYVGHGGPLTKERIKNRFKEKQNQ